MKADKKQKYLRSSLAEKYKRVLSAMSISLRTSKSARDNTKEGERNKKKITHLDSIWVIKKKKLF